MSKTNAGGLVESCRRCCCLRAASDVERALNADLSTPLPCATHLPAPLVFDSEGDDEVLGYGRTCRRMENRTLDLAVTHNLQSKF